MIYKVAIQFAAWFVFLRKHDIQDTEVYLSTMGWSSLNDVVLLHLMKFVDPVDRFNLVLSGICKRFENVNKGIDLRQMYFELLNLMQF